MPFCGTQTLAASGQPTANAPIRVAWLNYQQIDSAKFDTLESYFQDELDREVTIDRFTYSQSNQIAEGMRNGDIDFAFLTPYTYLTAEAQNPTIELFATYRLNGSELYRSVIVWERRDADSLDDLLQKLQSTSGKLALVHEFSTSGYIWPENWLRQRGIEISALHTHMNFEDQATHTAALEELVRNDPNSDTLAATVWEGAYAAFLQNYDGEPLQTYHIPPLIPNDPFVRRAGLSEEVSEAMKSALLNMDEQLGEAMVADGFQQWVEAQVCTYDRVRAFTGTPARPRFVDLAFQGDGDDAFRTHLEGMLKGWFWSLEDGDSVNLVKSVAPWWQLWGDRYEVELKTSGDTYTIRGRSLEAVAREATTQLKSVYPLVGFAEEPIRPTVTGATDGVASEEHVRALTLRGFSAEHELLVGQPVSVYSRTGDPCEEGRKQEFKARVEALDPEMDQVSIAVLGRAPGVVLDLYEAPYYEIAIEGPDVIPNDISLKAIRAYYDSRQFRLRYSVSLEHDGVVMPPRDVGWDVSIAPKGSSIELTGMEEGQREGRGSRFGGDRRCQRHARDAARVVVTVDRVCAVPDVEVALAMATLVGRVEWAVVGGGRGEKTIGTGLLWVWLAFSWALYSSVGGGLLRCLSFVTRCHAERVSRHWREREWRSLGWDGLGATWNAAKCIGPGLVATPLLCLMVLLTPGFWAGTPFAQMPPPLQIVVGTCCGYFGPESLRRVAQKIL
jgi:ABC-type phosphate/phosphonate transport system substrate-binding protein